MNTNQNADAIIEHMMNISLHNLCANYAGLRKEIDCVLCVVK